MGGAHVVGEHSWDSPFSWGGYAAYNLCTSCGERLNDASRGGFVASGVMLCHDCRAALKRCPGERKMCRKCKGSGMSDNKRSLCERCHGFGELVLGFMSPHLAIDIVERIGPVAFTDLAAFVPRYVEAVIPTIPDSFGCPACRGKIANGSWTRPELAWPCKHMSKPFPIDQYYRFPVGHIFDNRGNSRLCAVDCDAARCPIHLRDIHKQRTALISQMLPHDALRKEADHDRA